jgi:pimeloyl-ACP methyl ester carboxylesterase
MPKFMYRRSMMRLYGDPTRMTEGALEGSTVGIMNTPTITHIVDIMRGWDSDMAIIEDALSKLDPGKALLLWGDMDRAVSVNSGRRIAEMTGVRLAEIAGTGHMPFQEVPDECKEVLLRWLSQ